MDGGTEGKRIGFICFLSDATILRGSPNSYIDFTPEQRMLPKSLE